MGGSVVVRIEQTVGESTIIHITKTRLLTVDYNASNE